MNNNWKTLKLVEVATLQRGFDLPSRKRINGNYPIIAASGYTEMHNEYKVKGPGVITGRSGTLGKVFYEKKDFWPLNTSLWVKSFNGNNPLFIYYFLQTLNFLEFNSGTSVPTLNRNDVHSLEVEIPPIQEQKAIASILSALDDKIENNLAMNKTLEDMAMALYKHWFVDFGPFKDGEFVDSELGMIPKGWEVKRLDEIAEKKSETFNFKEKSEVVFINTGDVQEGRFLHSNRVSKDGLPGQAKKAISIGDILYSEIRPKNKRYAFVNFDSSDYVVSTKFMIINPKSNILNKLLYRILTMQTSVDRFNMIAEGRSGTFPQITFDAISETTFVLPPMQIQNEFQNIITPMESEQDRLHNENQTLTHLRDTLLPKLISGEVRLKEFKETLANVL